MPSSRSSSVIRAATWIGSTLGQWRRRRASAKDDAFVDLWKGAWQQGCDARLAGSSQEANPHRRNPRKAAWLAGWAWAESTNGTKPNSTTTDDAKTANAKSARAAALSSKSGARRG
jgi:ribosome modulation factor